MADKLAKKQSGGVEVYKDEGFQGLDQLPGVVPRWKIDHKKGLFFFSLSDDQKKELEVNIILGGSRRGKWNGGNVPECGSKNGEVGIITKTNEQRDCPACQYNVFGSDVKKDGSKGGGKACKQSYLNMCVLNDDMKPFLLASPPSSLGNNSEYFAKLAYLEVFPPYAVTTKLSLINSVSPDGFEYYKIAFEVGEEIEKERMQYLADLVKSYKQTFQQETVERDEQVGKDVAEDKLGAEPA